MVMAKLIHIIEDEKDIAKLMQINLSLEGYKANIFSTGEVGLNEVCKQLPDLVLLDLMLPGIDGFEVCKKLKANKNTSEIPIIMVSAKGEEEDIIRGLELGADDYITKPFSPKILVARVKAVFRRQNTQIKNKNDIIGVHELNVHPGKHEVKVSGKIINLTASEFQILHILSRRPGWVFTRSQIVDVIRGVNYAVTDRTIDFQMVGLRKKLGVAGEYIETVRGIGYRFKE